MQCEMRNAKAEQKINILNIQGHSVVDDNIGYGVLAVELSFDRFLCLVWAKWKFKSSTSPLSGTIFLFGAIMSIFFGGAIISIFGFCSSNKQ